MNFSISLLLATMATATATATSSKAYRIFNDPPRPKAGKTMISSFSSVSEGSITAKSSKALSLSTSLYVSSSSKSSKILVLPSSLSISSKTVKESKAVKEGMDKKSKTDKGTGGISEHSGDMSGNSGDIIDDAPSYYSKSFKDGGGGGGGGAKSAKKSKTGAESGADSKSSKVDDNTGADSKSSKEEDTGVDSKSSKVTKAKVAKRIPQFSHAVFSLPTYSPTFEPSSEVSLLFAPNGLLYF